MKKIVTMAATAAAALAVMAAFGAASASAGTVLCAKAATTCTSTADIKPSGTTLVIGGSTNFEYTGFRLQASGKNTLKCSSNLMSAKTTVRNGNPLTGTLQGSLEGCLASDVGSCTGASMNNPSVTIEGTENGGGVMKIGHVNDPLSVTFTCNIPGFGQNTCTYKASDAVTMNIGAYGEQATISGATLAKSAGGAACGGNQTLTVNDAIGGEPASYIAKRTETVLCAEAAIPCPNGLVQPAGSSMIAGSLYQTKGMALKSSNGAVTLTCPGNTIAFKSTQEYGSSWLPAETTFLVAAERCGFWIPSNTACSSVTMNSPPALLLVEGGKGRAVIGGAAGLLTLSFTCQVGEASATCQYMPGAGFVGFNVNYATQVGTTEASMYRTEGPSSLCPANQILTMEDHVGNAFVSTV